MALWIYGYSEGIGSARELSRMCEYEPGCQWLTGMQPVNHHALSDFRVEHKDELDGDFRTGSGTAERRRFRGDEADRARRNENQSSSGKQQFSPRGSYT